MIARVPPRSGTSSLVVALGRLGRLPGRATHLFGSSQTLRRTPDRSAHSGACNARSRRAYSEGVDNVLTRALQSTAQKCQHIYQMTLNDVPVRHWYPHTRAHHLRRQDATPRASAGTSARVDPRRTWVSMVAAERPRAVGGMLDGRRG